MYTHIRTNEKQFSSQIVFNKLKIDYFNEPIHGHGRSHDFKPLQQLAYMQSHKQNNNNKSTYK